MKEKSAQKVISDIEGNITKWPSVDTRRKLARALGVRHVDLLIAAGELNEDELPVEGAIREAIPPDDPRRPAYDALIEFDPYQTSALGDLGIVLFTLSQQRERKARQ